MAWLNVGYRFARRYGPRIARRYGPSAFRAARRYGPGAFRYARRNFRPYRPFWAGRRRYY